VGGVVLVSTYGYAFAFSRIYVTPITRIEASRWIYENIPGPINLHLTTSEGEYHQILPFPYQGTITSQAPFVATFRARQDSLLEEDTCHTGLYQGDNQPRTLVLSILERNADEPSPRRA
jgi:hypothetical protein